MNNRKVFKLRKSYFLTMETIKLSSKGQIVIPQKMRSELKMNEGSILGIEKMKDIIVIKKIDVDLVKQFKKGLEDLKSGKITRVA